MSIAAPALAADATFGQLPVGAMSTSVTSDVRAEICREHLFDPSRAQASVPSGYRLILADEYAKEDVGVAPLVTSNRRYASYGVGVLCLMSIDTFVVDGVRVRSSSPISVAFWWVRAAGPRDPRMRGRVDWLQLASWYSRDVMDRERILATDPMAQFVDLDVAQAEPGVWRMRLVLADESIEAEVRGSGPRKRRSAPEPGFMSVPFTGKSAGSFWVISYSGHHHQSAQGEWRVNGAGVFKDALQIPGEASVFKTSLQDGWSALSGLYRPER